MDLDEVTADAVTDIDRDLLVETGKGGLLSNGYLHDNPLIEYIRENENIGAVLWSDTTAPKIEGLPRSDVTVDNYRSITVVTDQRILTVTGTETGDHQISIPLSAIEGLSKGKRGRIRTEQWLRVSTPAGCLTVFDRSGADLDAVVQFLVDAVSAAKQRRLKDTIEEAVALENNSELEPAYHKFREAIQEREQLYDWRDLYDTNISTVDRNVEGDLSRVGDRIDIADCVTQATQAEGDAQFEEARAAYKKIQEIVQSSPVIEPPVNIETQLTRVNLREAHEAVHELINQGDQATDRSTKVDAYRDALYKLDQYEERLRDCKDTFFQSTSAGKCDLCGREDTVALVGVNGSGYRVCPPCEDFLNKDVFWTLSDIGDIRDDLANRLVSEVMSLDATPEAERSPPQAELRVALSEIADQTGRPPSTTDVREKSPYIPGEILGAYKDWGEALDDADTDVREALLEEIQDRAGQRGLVPTKQEVVTNSIYPESVFESTFEDVDTALSVAGYETRGVTDSAWKKTLRDLADSASDPPLPKDARSAGVDIQRLLSRFDSWNDVLSAAGILQSLSEGSQDDILVDIERVAEDLGRVPSKEEYAEHGTFKLDTLNQQFDSFDAALSDADLVQTDILADIEDVAAALEHIPSKNEYSAYGSFSTAAVRERFGSFDAALSEADLTQTNDLEPTGPLDEPPDGGTSIPSHTTLLRELNWLRHRYGPTEARERFEERSSFDQRHFELQFGSVDQVFDHLDVYRGKDENGESYAPKRLLNERLSTFGDTFNRPPTLLDLLYQTDIPLRKFADKFDSLAALQEAAGYTTETRFPTTEDILSDVISVAASLVHPPTIAEYDENGAYDFARVIRRFDSWVAALNAADLDALSIPREIVTDLEQEVDRVRFEAKLRISTGLGVEELLLDELHRLAYEFGAPPSETIIQRFSQYPLSAYRSAFDSLETARERAGLDATQTADTPTEYKQRLSSSLSSLHEQYGHHPTRRLVNARGDSPVIAYIGAYGSWKAALEATFEDPAPPAVSRPYLESELRTIAEQQEVTDAASLLHQLPDECGVCDIRRVFGSISDAVELINETGDDATRQSPDVTEPPSSGDESERSESSTPSNSKDASSDTDGAGESDFSDSEPSEETTEADGMEDGESDDPTREELLEELQRLNTEKEGLLKADHMTSDGEYQTHHYISEFGSWNQALEAIGVDKKELLLEELEWVGNDLGKKPTTSDMNKHARYSPSMYYDIFDSWDDALAQADLKKTETSSDEVSEGTTTSESDSSTLSGEQSSGDGDEQAPTRADLLDELTRVDGQIDGTIKATDMLSEGSYKIGDYTDEFGSWDAALQKAGIDKEEELLAEIERVWDEIGERPSRADMNEHGRVSATTVTNYFESWKAACENAKPSIQSDYLEDVEDVTICEEVPDNERLSGTFVAKVTWRVSEPNRRKDAELRVDDIRETECWIDIWRKHEVDCEFPEGHWYLLKGLRGKVWHDDGERQRRLSSTRDLQVTDFGTDPDPTTLREEAQTRGLLGSETTQIDQDQNQTTSPDRGAGSSASTTETTGSTTEEESMGSAKQSDGESAVESTSTPTQTTSSEAKDHKEPARDDLIDELQRFGQRTEKTPREQLVTEYGKYEPEAYYREFGSWIDALQAAGIDPYDPPSRDREYTNVDILDSIKELAEEFGRLPSTSEMNEHGEMSATMANARFGSWENALELVKPVFNTDVGERDTSTNETSGGSIGVGGDSQELDEMVTIGLEVELKRLDDELDGVPEPEDIDEYSDHDPEEFIETYGSWEAALAAAGISK